MVTHNPGNNHPPSQFIARLVIQLPRMNTNHFQDGHTTPGWSSINPRMLTHRYQDNQSPSLGYRAIQKKRKNSFTQQNGFNSVNFYAIWLKFYMKVNETFMKFCFFISHPADTLIKIKILPKKLLYLSLLRI